MANKFISAESVVAPATVNMAKSDVATQLALLDNMKANSNDVYTGAQCDAKYALINNPVFSGNVGVGTTNPGSMLHLASSSALEQRITHNSNGSIVLRRDGTVGYMLSESGVASYRNLVLGTQVGPGGTINEAMRITADNKVGINTASPTSALEVMGSLTVSKSDGHGIILSKQSSEIADIGTHNGVTWSHVYLDPVNQRVGLNVPTPLASVHGAGSTILGGVAISSFTLLSNTQWSPNITSDGRYQLSWKDANGNKYVAYISGTLQS